MPDSNNTTTNNNSRSYKARHTNVSAVRAEQLNVSELNK